MSWPTAIFCLGILTFLAAMGWIGSRPAPTDTTKLVELVQQLADLNRRLDAITADLRTVNNGQERQ